MVFPRALVHAVANQKNNTVSQVFGFVRRIFTSVLTNLGTNYNATKFYQIPWVLSRSRAILPNGNSSKNMPKPKRYLRCERKGLDSRFRGNDSVKYCGTSGYNWRYLGLLVLAQVLILAAEYVLRTSVFVTQPRAAVATP